MRMLACIALLGTGCTAAAAGGSMVEVQESLLRRARFDLGCKVDSAEPIDDDTMRLVGECGRAATFVRICSSGGHGYHCTWLLNSAVVSVAR